MVKVKSSLAVGHVDYISLFHQTHPLDSLGRKKRIKLAGRFPEFSRNFPRRPSLRALLHPLFSIHSQGLRLGGRGHCNGQPGLNQAGRIPVMASTQDGQLGCFCCFNM